MSHYGTSGDLDLASLGTATGTRVDSPAKHIMACKVDTNYLIKLLGNANSQHTDPYTVLHQNKMRWCMHKDEIALFTGKNLFANRAFNTVNPKAYPLVITTIGEMHELAKRFLINLYDQDTAFSFYNFVETLNKNDWQTDATKRRQVFGDTANADRFNALNQQRDRTEYEILDNQIKSTPDFRCQGIALGQAFASHMSGDTVASVLVGGVMTVLNGAFPMQTGDLVQWYFDFEENQFDIKPTPNQGCRHTQSPEGNMDPQSADWFGLGKKRTFMDAKNFGIGSGYGRDYERCKDTRGIVRIKSYQYRPRRFYIEDDTRTVTLPTKESYGDKIRVFAKCISGGRPFDAVDIMLMTQSL